MAIVQVVLFWRVNRDIGAGLVPWVRGRRRFDRRRGDLAVRLFYVLTTSAAGRRCRDDEPNPTNHVSHDMPPFVSLTIREQMDE